MYDQTYRPSHRKDPRSTSGCIFGGLQRAPRQWRAPHLGHQGVGTSCSVYFERIVSGVETGQMEFSLSKPDEEEEVIKSCILSDFFKKKKCYDCLFLLLSLTNFLAFLIQPWRYESHFLLEWMIYSGSRNCLTSLLWVAFHQITAVT